jgi:hypothetical protein
MLAGALSWVGRWYRPDGSMSPTQIADQGIALLLGGVLAPVPAPSSSTAVPKLRSRAPRKTVT